MTTETRKKCQFCRFQGCLKAGLRQSWVLSEQERRRRFSKHRRDKERTFQPIVRSSVLVFSFSAEDKKVLSDIYAKFNVPWLQNLVVFDSNAAINLISYSFNLSKQESQEFIQNTWTVFKRSMSLNFIHLILPRFEELSELSSSDIGQLMHSKAAGIAQFFRSCHMFKIGGHIQGKVESCPITSEVTTLSKNANIMSRPDIQVLLSTLDMAGSLARMARMVTYEELYPVGWAGNKGAERRHRDAVYKITNWPKNKEGKFDTTMVVLMTLILVFHADFYTLINRDKLEKIQMKYIMILHRYLRSKLSTEGAGKKFLDAMLLIEETRLAWEISCQFSPCIPLF